MYMRLTEGLKALHKNGHLISESEFFIQTALLTYPLNINCPYCLCFCFNFLIKALSAPQAIAGLLDEGQR